mgnify:CR=1 FL=1
MFKEKVAVVTGGASGIGLATTKKLLSDTYSIKEEKLWEDIFFIKGEKIK